MDEELCSVYRWWRSDTETPEVTPRDLTLDALWEVEERLTAEQWDAYLNHFATPAERIKKHFFWERGSVLLHAAAEQKIKALAQVLRGEVIHAAK